MESHSVSTTKKVRMDYVSVDQRYFRNRVLNYVLKMQTGPTQFRMNDGADSTIFTSCFALFIFNLFGEVHLWSQKEIDIWIDYISSFQDRDSGYFVPHNFRGDLNTKLVQQLTCFCLSSLDIFGVSPMYEFSFLKQWPHTEDVHTYLRDIGCFKGKPTTGNIAMALAIFLTYQYEKYKDESALDRLDSWFYWHEKTQNRSTGFWGNSLRKKYYAGFQNAFHQFVIYNYWSRRISRHKNIVDIVLSLQDVDGFFAPTPGGGACWDYDAADILINCGYKRGYRKKEIKDVLVHLYFAILRGQSEDGGFCESRKRPSSSRDIMTHSKFIFSGCNPELWYYRLRATLGASRRKEESIKTHWTCKGRLWGQSDLWNTWFKCLSLAEIANTIKLKNDLGLEKANFHRMIGLGFFNN